ncbi:MAG TPA: KGG domain-containing protein [Chitinophagaceae bacterium]|nr:KGG domain-containing protein [Chitinophagaceae bacterium]
MPNSSMPDNAKNENRVADSNNENGNNSNTGNGKPLRGFAAMDEQRRKEIASKGGKAAHEKGTAHEFTSEEAREAGRKGGSR